MKRIFGIVVLMLVLACSAVAPAAGQAKINTKKLKIADLATRTTKVVLGSGDFVAGALRDEVSARWRISPYEFCTVEEYNALKESSDYYFLLIARSEEKKYRGLLTLTLMKGGQPKAEDPQKRPVEVASLPFSSAGFPSGREVVFLPALLDILQDYVAKAMRSDGAGYTGFDIYARQVRKTGIKRIFFSEDDLVPDMDETFRRQYFDEDMVIMSEAEADKAFQDGTYNTLVSYVVAPFDPQDGSWCYKMLIDAGTHELLYFKHHRISVRKWAGFLPEDIKTIFAKR
jgi:hypothetical protein